jgi:hypothetical protein
MSKKSLFTVFVVFMIMSMLLTACGASVVPPQYEAINTETGVGVPPGPDAGGTTSVLPEMPFVNENNMASYVACQEIALRNFDKKVQSMVFPNNVSVPAQVTNCGNGDIENGVLASATTIAATSVEVTILAYVATAYGLYLLVVYLDKSGAIEEAGKLIQSSITSEQEVLSVSISESDEMALEYAYVSIALEGAYMIHNPAHDVIGNEANTKAVLSMISNHSTWVSTGGPNNRNSNQDFVCKALEVGGKVVANILWHMTDPKLKTGEIVIWSANRWITYFTGKSYSTLNNPPVDIVNEFFKTKTRVRVINVGCNNLPPQPPLLAP